MTRGPFLGLAAAGVYCGRPRADAAAARWSRRHLVGRIPHARIPGSGIVFSQRDLDHYLTQFTIAPTDPLPTDSPAPSVLDEILGPRKKGRTR